MTELLKFIDDTKTGKSTRIVTFEPSPYGNSFKIPDQKFTLDDTSLLKINIKCWEGISLLEEEVKMFIEIIHKHAARKKWIYFLNERRIKSNFIMPFSGFTTLSDLMLLFLDSIQKDLDENSAKLSIVLAQTFYYEKYGEKVYLITALSSHKLWELPEIWAKMIEEGIRKEIENYAQFCTDETSEEHKSQLSAIIFSQMSSYVHIMKTFGFQKEYITLIVESLIDKFNISDTNLFELIE